MPKKKCKPIGRVLPKAKKMKQKRANETDEQRASRLEAMRLRASIARASETMEQRKSRLEKMRQRTADLRKTRLAGVMRQRARTAKYGASELSQVMNPLSPSLNLVTSLIITNTQSPFPQKPEEYRAHSASVEIKASITNAQSVINKAAELGKSHGVCLEQQDTYFNVSQGHLKLRETLDDVPQLVFYERPDEDSPKLSGYSKQTFRNNAEAQGLKACLSAALGVKGIVKKKRHLFMVGSSRLHVDYVDDLGDFVELEVMLQDNQSIEEGQKKAEDLMDQLGVPKEALICCSYIDLLLA